MRDVVDIVRAFESLAANGQAAALACVVGVEGSAYRQTGARMLVASDGRFWGSISGGCFERDVSRQGRSVIDSAGDEPILACYETTDQNDDDGEMAQPGPSLGCGGRIEILIHRVSRDRAGAIAAMSSALRNRVSADFATLVAIENVDVGVRPGQQLLRIDGTSPQADWNNPELTQKIVAEFEKGGPNVRKRFIVNGKWVDVFLERFDPPQSLVIFGDGQDVVPLVNLAQVIGWHVTVVGTRAQATLQSRFAGADRVISTSEDDPAGGILPVESGAVAVVMAHHFRRDTAVLGALLRNSPPAYVGVLGPKRRTARMIESLGLTMDCPQLFAPVGLDIGAQSPEEIALAIVAEIQSVTSGRSSGSLRNRPGPIHPDRKSATCKM